MAQQNPNLKEIVKELNDKSNTPGNSKLSLGLDRIIKEVAAENETSLQDIRFLIKTVFYFSWNVIHRSVWKYKPYQYIKNLVRVRWTHFGNYAPSDFKIRKVFKGKDKVQLVPDETLNKYAEHTKK